LKGFATVVEPLKSSTPEFLRWTLAVACNLKDFSQWKNPDKVERHLRAVRVCETAIREGRVLDGICVAAGQGVDDSANTLGFRIADVVESFVSLEAIAGTCEKCPANAIKELHPLANAGCFGLMPITNIDVYPVGETTVLGGTNLQQLLDEVLRDNFELSSRITKYFPLTRPAWYGLWIPDSPSLQQRQVQLEVMDELLVAVTDTQVNLAWKLFTAALRISVKHDFEIRIELCPAGVRDNVNWTVPEHCCRCHAPWKPDLRKSMSSCQICKYQGHPNKRHQGFVQGKRPYWKLSQFLGEQQAALFLEQYRQREG
jgi:hypothetical protein